MNRSALFSLFVFNIASQGISFRWLLSAQFSRDGIVGALGIRGPDGYYHVIFRSDGTGGVRI